MDDTEYRSVMRVLSGVRLFPSMSGRIMSSNQNVPMMGLNIDLSATILPTDRQQNHNVTICIDPIRGHILVQVLVRPVDSTKLSKPRTCIANRQIE